MSRSIPWFTVWVLLSSFDVASLLIVFSASGNSKNIVRLLQGANYYKIPSWAFLGFNGGVIATMPNVKSILFMDDVQNYGLIENVHLSATHFVIDQLMKKVVES